MVGFLSRLNGETEILLSLSIILFSGFIMTRMTNTLNMPKVSGYILAGILIGPCVLNFIPGSIIEGMSFVSDLALAFIAFGVGKFFKKEVLMRTGRRIIVITISEALAAGVLVTLVLKLFFGLSWDFALILGAIATATAPASTMMTINQYKAKGEFVDTLLQIVALDDVVCLLSFSIVSAIINGNAAGGVSASDILVPIASNLLVIGLGVFCGYFLSRLLIPARSRDNRLILAIAMLLGLSGICAALDISPLLSCMVYGAFYINLTEDKKLFRQINNFTPPVMSIFFIVSGMNLNVSALSVVGAIGVAYFVVRIVGKYLGTYLSCLAMGTSREIRNYMGFALIPQAGVAIGLAFLGQRMLPPETGNLMMTIILASSVLYEMVGPVSAKAALFLSGSISREKQPDKNAEGQVPETEGSASAEGIREQEGAKILEMPGCLEAVSKPEKEQSFSAISLERCPDAEAGAAEPGQGSTLLTGESGNQELPAGGSFPEGESEADPEDESHAVLPELLEYSRDVDEGDDFNIEKDIAHQEEESCVPAQEQKQQKKEKEIKDKQVREKEIKERKRKKKKGKKSA